MDQQLLSSRAIVGMYYAPLETDAAGSWIDVVSNLFQSDQPSETYNWLGQTPRMREWIASRQAKGFTGNGVTIVNKHYEATIEVQKKDVRRDKTPQLRARMQEFRSTGDDHWDELLTDLLIAAESTVCYDGQYFFDTDHTEGDSGTQDNDIAADISTAPASIHGVTTAPSNEEMQWAIVKGIAQIMGFKDDRARPMNTRGRKFAVVVPTPLWQPAMQATTVSSTLALLQQMNPNMVPGLELAVHMNPRLTWTDKFAVFRTDAPVKSFIRQTEQEVELKVKGEGSEFEFDNDAWQFGIDAWRGAGYGHWQRSCLVTMT